VADLTSPSVGLDRLTGGTITGWEHVLQSLEDIFTTRFGERIMREWYGSNVSNLLGRNITPVEVTGYFQELLAPIEQWEPRFRVTQIIALKVTRDGQFHFYIDGEYRPRATYGDFTVEGARRIYGNAARNGQTLLERSE
jgi:phage baseplate assembly protein W